MERQLRLVLINLILIISSTNNFAQDIGQLNGKLVKKYKMFFEDNSEIFGIGYDYSVEKKDGKYLYKKYNPDKLVMTHLKTFSDYENKVKDGKYKEWFDNGELRKIGSYTNNKKSGKWEFYNFGTRRLEYGEFKEGLEEGRWFVVDSLKRKFIEYNCVAGDFQGDYINYDTTGSVIYRIVYKDDEMVEKIILDSLKYFKQKTDCDSLAILKKCIELEGTEREECRKKSFNNYVFGEIKYPKTARQNNVEGTALFRFYIDKKGVIRDIVTARGVCKEIEEECLRVIKESPEWSPGIIDGKPIKVYWNQPIKFKLE